MRETEEGRKEKEKRVGGPSFEDHVTKKRRALGTRKGGEPHQNSFTEQVFEDAVKGTRLWENGEGQASSRTGGQLEELFCAAAPCRASGGLMQKCRA